MIKNIIICLFILLVSGCSLDNNNPMMPSINDNYNIEDVSTPITAVSDSSKHDLFRRLIKHLNLSENQANLAKTFVDTYQASIKDTHSDLKANLITHQEAKTKIVKARRSFITSFTFILSDIQKRKFKHFIHRWW